jgi:sodium transport system permease protein
MKWSNVKLIFQREVRDQMRDRRTLFTIAVLPLLLYPLLGMTFLQVAQFLRDHPTRIWIIGSDALPERPLLIESQRFAADLSSDADSRLLQLTIDATLPEGISADDLRDVATKDKDVLAEGLREHAQKQIRAGRYDAVVYFPPDFAEKLNEFRALLRDSQRTEAPSTLPVEAVPTPTIFFDTASDKSRIAYDRLSGILRAWREKMVEQNLKDNRIPVSATQPFDLVKADVAEEVSRRAAVWSKILPFVVLVWALTGAFYPAIDLCAGEKERGTLETLLSSPAQRSEIVWGKLLTVMVFSMTTSLLNLLSMGFTGLFIIRQFEQLGDAGAHLQIGSPPLAAAGWLVLALIPISALFSALSLAIAAFARSSKEGQYYLMPLLMITLPLMMLPMLPAAELDLGTSLIPVTGMMLLLRSLIEGQYGEALRYAIPVVGVTALCCMLAIRWAIDQFNNESVLFRESERWGLRLWLTHLVRDRGETPNVGEALLCGVILLLIKFFAGFVAVMPDSPQGLATLMLVTQIALIATPALMMAIMLTRSPRKTLLLRMPRPLTLPAAVLLAVLLNPLVMLLGQGIERLYPINDEVIRSLSPLTAAIQQSPLLYVLALVALLPAICEELAFRGFILSGLRHMGHKWAAIILSSILFGVMHGLLQQSLATCVIGVVIGYIAVQTGSLLPGILFHMTNNSLGVLNSRITPEIVSDYPVLGWLFHSVGEKDFGYNWPVAVIAGLLSAGVFIWLHSLPYQASAEEKHQEALDHQAAHVAAR